MPLTDIPGTTRTGKSTATLDGVFRRNRDHNTSGAAVMRCPRWVTLRHSQRSPKCRLLGYKRTSILCGWTSDSSQELTWDVH